jgi:transposase-like protein
LNNIIAQEHRGVKRVTRPLLGLTSCDAAQGTPAGIELMPMLQQGHLAGEEAVAGLTPAAQCYALAA